MSGDLVPIWLQGIGTMAQAGIVGAQLWVALQTQQAQVALDWAALVESLSAIEGDDLARLIEASPVVAEIVGRAGAQAALTASEQKRLLLAKVVAAVLRGEADDAELDGTRLLTRTIEALDEPHLSLLARMLLPRPGHGQLAGTVLEGAWTHDDLVREWPAANELVRPLVNALETQGLVDNVGAGTYDGRPAFTVNSYGMRLLRYLPSVNPVDLERAHLAVRAGDRRGEIHVTNLGPGEARNFRLASSMTPNRIPVGMPNREDVNGAVLPPNAVLTIEHWTPDRPADDTGYLVGLAWSDASGDQTAVLELRRPK